MIPNWLANMEFFLNTLPIGQDMESELVTLLYFAKLGNGWLDRTHIAGNPEAIAALKRALLHYYDYCDFRELDENKDDALYPAIQFVKRGTNLLRSLDK